MKPGDKHSDLGGQEPRVPFRGGRGGMFVAISHLLGRHRFDTLSQDASSLDEPDIWAIFSGGLMAVTRDGVIRRTNRDLEEVFQYGRGELQGKHVSVLIPPRFRVSYDKQFKDYLASPEKRKRRKDLVAYRKDGTEFPVSITLNPAMKSAKELQIFVSVRDISAEEQLEFSLQKKETILRAVIDNLPAIVSIKEASGRYYLVNRQFEEFFELSRGEVIGKSSKDLFPEGLAKSFAEKDRQVFNSKIPFTVEETIEFRRKKRSFISLRFILQLHSDDSPLLCAISTDITEKKGAERAMQDLAAIVESSGDAILSITLEGKILTLNSSATRMFGYSAKEITGKSVFMLVPLGRGSELQETLKRIRRGEQIEHSETVRLRKDGTYMDISLCISPVLNSEGIVDRASWVCRDITSRKQTDARLLQLSRVVEQTADLVLITDDQGKIEYVNRSFEKLTGFSKEEVMGKKPNILKSNQYSQEFYKNLWQVIRRGEPFQNDLVSRKKNGELFHTEKTITPLKDSTGRITHFVSTDKDVTDKKKVEEEYRSRLQHSNEELAQFASVASHDLQEPLRTIGCFLELLRKKVPLDVDSQEYIKFVVDATKRLREMIADLLAYSRVEGHTTQQAPVNCETVLTSVLADLKGAIDQSGARVSHGVLPTLRGDASQMSLVFQNLIGNAIKYRRPKGSPEVHIEAVRREGEWCFSVSDNGIGIASDERQNVFIMFRRLHGRGEYPGTGIGLAMCRKIVEGSGGKIWIESNPKGGSTFFFTIPERSHA